MVSTSTTLVAEGQQKQQQQQSQQSERMVQSSKSEENVIVAEFDPPTTNQSSDDFYSLEELEQLEDESMALIVKRFSNVRFKRIPSSSTSPTTTDSRKVDLHPLTPAVVDTKQGWLIGAPFDALTAMSWDTLPQNAGSQSK